MLVENVLIRPHGLQEVSLSWTSESADSRSYIFINGSLVVSGFMAGTKERSATLPVPPDSTFRIEIHEFTDEDVSPNSTEELPQVRPQVAWNSVDTATSYKVYHTIFPCCFSGGEIESLLATVPAIATERIEINCPVKLEGKSGRWHSFRVEAIDQFGNESVSEVIPHFAVDLPPPPKLTISRDTQTGLLSFRIL
ncbi:hypothetical protein FACS1894189_0650 [Planctomycetales bacterium]|nr:hypothetical protein FACS1894189_0650 [Planctomycetales bacterium]